MGEIPSYFVIWDGIGEYSGDRRLAGMVSSKTGAAAARLSSQRGTARSTGGFDDSRSQNANVNANLQAQSRPDE
jgi:hypothetical protein